MFPQAAQVRGHSRSPNGVPQKEQWEFLIVIVTGNEISVLAAATSGDSRIHVRPPCDGQCLPSTRALSTAKLSCAATPATARSTPERMTSRGCIRSPASAVQTAAR